MNTSTYVMITATAKVWYLVIYVYDLWDRQYTNIFYFMNIDNLSAMYLGVKRSFLEDHQGQTEIYSPCPSGNFDYVPNFCIIISSDR